MLGERESKTRTIILTDFVIIISVIKEPTNKEINVWKNILIKYKDVVSS